MYGSGRFALRSVMQQHRNPRSRRRSRIHLARRATAAGLAALAFVIATVDTAAEAADFIDDARSRIGPE